MQCQPMATRSRAVACDKRNRQCMDVLQRSAERARRCSFKSAPHEITRGCARQGSAATQRTAGAVHVVWVILTAQLRVDTASHHSFVLLGAAGDLAAKKTYPSLFKLYLGRYLPNNVALVGCDGAAFHPDVSSADELWERRIAAQLRKQEGATERDLSEFRALLSFVNVDISVVRDFLNDALALLGDAMALGSAVWPKSAPIYSRVICRSAVVAPRRIRITADARMSSAKSPRRVSLPLCLAASEDKEVGHVSLRENVTPLVVSPSLL